MDDTITYEYLCLSQGFDYLIYTQIFVPNQIYFLFLDQKVLQVNISSIIEYGKINIL